MVNPSKWRFIAISLMHKNSMEPENNAVSFESGKVDFARDHWRATESHRMYTTRNRKSKKLTDTIE